MSLLLKCLILGDDPRRQLFNVKIQHNKNVSNLKDSIKEKMASRLNDFDASDIDLWQVSFPLNGLGTTLGNLNLSAHQELVPTWETLTTFFTDVADDCLHVIVRPPAITLNCYILGTKDYFPVEIARTVNVGILRRQIRAEAPLILGQTDTLVLSLWQVSFPIADLTRKDPPTLGPQLRIEKLISDLFPSMPDSDYIHIVVHNPKRGDPASSSGPLHSAYRFQIPPADDIGRARETFCNQRISEAPSDSGKPQVFLRYQERSVTYIPCNRPSRGDTALPLSLLHPVFGEFLDDAENYTPTPDDVRFFLAFVQEMPNIYTKKKGRREALEGLFYDHDILPIYPTFTADDDLSIGNFRFLITEFNDEIGSSEAGEPYFQAILHYLEATRELAPQHHNSVLPCIIVLIFGPYVAFAGAAWTDRPTVQMLSPAIPCHYHDTNLKMENMLVRHLGAFRRAIRSLYTYYKEHTANPDAPRRNPTQPYPTSFTSPDGSVHRFTYHSYMNGRSMFFGHIYDANETAICIKFAPRYCEAAHRFLAAQGVAPRLHTVTRLPGGMYMVVMDDVSEAYVRLFDLIQDNPHEVLSEAQRAARDGLSANVERCLRQFHEAGYVHGDIRDTNIMVKRRDGFGFVDGEFILLDYDSAGRIEREPRYPLVLNTTSVWRPEGARGGAVIQAEHDLEMLGHIWDW